MDDGPLQGEQMSNKRTIDGVEYLLRQRRTFTAPDGTTRPRYAVLARVRPAPWKHVGVLAPRRDHKGSKIFVFMAVGHNDVTSYVGRWEAIEEAATTTLAGLRESFAGEHARFREYFAKG